MTHSDITIGEKPKIEMDVAEGKVRLSWKTSLLRKCLDLHIDDCVGCGLCLPCPWDAITLGPVQETAAGRIEGAPLVNVDPETCIFCGLCDSACVFRAFEASYEGEGAVNEYGRIKGVHVLDEEKCAPCLLCAKVCPREAIEVEFSIDKKKDLVIYDGEESAEGTIKIDEDKCSYCGLCEELCPEAIKIFWSESAEPPSFRPAVGIRVNEDECDYCGLCAKICPDDAIEVNCIRSSKRTISDPKIDGKLKIDDNLCVDCSLCAEVCPYDALNVEKPFTGEVIIQNLEKCDPTGCFNCFNICPVKAIYPTGTAEKIAIADKHCIYCGACENACPYDVLIVKREGYKLDELEEQRAWEKARKQFFDTVVGKEPPPSNLFERNIQVPKQEAHSIQISQDDSWALADGDKKMAMKTVKRLQKLLQDNPTLLMQIERGKIDPVVEKVKKSQKENQ